MKADINLILTSDYTGFHTLLDNTCQRNLQILSSRKIILWQ